jgi:hypothetical protein
MTAAVLALALILSLLFFGIALVTFYELVAVRDRSDSIETISSWWTRLHRGRLTFLIVLGVALTALYVFLVGDLVFELW